jgi:outer membrane autotransporter protein
MSTRRLPSTLVALALVAAPAVAYNLVITPQAPSVGEFRNTLTVTVALSGCDNPANQVTWDAFTVELDPTEATAGADFGGPTPKAFPVGNGALTSTIVIPIVQDALPEPNERFDLVLRPRPVQTLNCANGNLNPVLSEYRARVTILDDDSQPGLSIADDKVGEGNSGSRSGVFQVRLSPAATGTVTVNYRTRDGSARAGSDYRSTSGQLVFPAGQTSAAINVEVFGDTLVEGDETFFVDLLQASGAQINRGRGTGTIRDDDGTAPPPSPRQLTAVGALERDVATGGATELQVRVTNSDGTGVSGAIVEWGVDGDAQLVGGLASVADPTGLASKTVVMGASSPTVLVTAVVANAAPVTFTLRRSASFGSLFDPGDDPGLASVADVLDQLCAESSNRYASLCGYLGDLGPDDARRAIEELAPTEALAQSDVALESARAGLRTIQERQRQLRRAARRGRGGGGVALDLSLPAGVRRAGSSLPFVSGPGGEPAIRGPRVADDGFDAEVAAALAADVDAAFAAGGGLAAAQEPSSSSEAGAEEKRGGFFLSGRLTRGDRDATSRDAGLDYDATGGTLGVDYRTGARLFLGVAGGYADSGADFTGGGDLSLKGENLTAYLTYAGDAFFFDLVAGFGQDSYKLKRDLSLPTGSGVQLVHGVGEPDGDERLAEMGLGWDISAGAATWTISGRASYVDVSIDRFVETLSAGGVELEIFDQDVESLLAEASIEWTYAASFGWGVLQPQLSAAARHEFEDEAHELRGRFVGDPAGGVFTLPSEPVDATYFAARAGLTAVFPGGFAVYGNLEQEFGRDGLNVATASAGLRFEW